MRTGLVSTAALTLALLAGSPALADDVLPQVGDSCAPETLLPATLVCVDGLVAAAPPVTLPDPAPTDTPSQTPTDPQPTDPPADPQPTDPPSDPLPDPLPVDVPPVLGGGGGTTAGGTGSGAGSGDGTSTSTDPSTPGTSAGGTTTGDGSTPPGTTLHAAATSKDPATTTKSMLSAATVSNLASSDLPTLAAMRSLPVAVGHAGLPLSAYTPSPLVANLPAVTALSSVQAPLLAVGDDAANSGGFTLAGLSNRALPGLLVVLATALVAAVGAGNLRYWQDRFGTRR